MSGHSKWHSIRHKKAVVDARRGAAFTKLIKELQVAARMGGSDLDANPRLRTAVQTARDANMPKDNIERAIKKGAGELEGVSYEDFVFEGYGQAGVAILVEGTTDNMNRTAGEIRHTFSKYGGNFGEPGCVAWMFEKRGLIVVSAEGRDEESMMETVIEAGGEDLELDDDSFRIVTDATSMHEVRDALEAMDVKVRSSEIEYHPSNTIELTVDNARKLLSLIEMLEEHDDVRSVWANYEIDDAVLEELSA